MRIIFWIGYLILHLWTVVLAYQVLGAIWAIISLFVPVVPLGYLLYIAYQLFGILPYHYFSLVLLLFWICWKYIALNEILSE
ncbi:MAG: hypothetical protein H6Q67_986 [Firmicutes bacterium]|nr:hypothetical protein [Bacillota bacterium]